jgi:tail tube protein gp19
MPDEQLGLTARFSLTVDGYSLGTFEELAGLNQTVDTVDYMESGDDLLILTKLPIGGVKPTLRLGRPKTTDLKLRAWYDANSRVRPTPKKNCTLTVHEATHTDNVRFLLPNAWLSALVTEQRTSGGRAATWELATLVCDRIQRI